MSVHIRRPGHGRRLTLWIARAKWRQDVRGWCMTWWELGILHGWRSATATTWLTAKVGLLKLRGQACRTIAHPALLANAKPLLIRWLTR